MGAYGFVITRHVNSEQTNKYWNQCIKLIRTYYPYRQIILIDDNSNYSFVKADHPYKNLTIIQSEYPGRGELLPFIYYLKYRWWDNAVFLHDSVFIHKHIPFELLKVPVLPLWHFIKDKLHHNTVVRVSGGLSNNSEIMKILQHEDSLMSINKLNTDWCGVFGVQCFININFLEQIQNKYNITNLILYVSCRDERCALERIMGIIIFLEYPAYRFSLKKSVLGDIRSYMPWGYNYDQYISSFKNHAIVRHVVKVWTGR